MRTIWRRAGSQASRAGTGAPRIPDPKIWDLQSSRDVSATALRASQLLHTPLRTSRERIVVLGTGWGAARLARDIDTKLYDLCVVSPRNHMVFTPLLTSACVGTVEPRSVAVAILTLQPALRGQLTHKYYAASATAVDPAAKVVRARDDTGASFSLPYDKLVIATGSQGSTFGIPGVEQHTNFLRDIRNAEDIRTKLIRNWQKAHIPGRPRQERERLLHTVIVGGGPTGVEFAGELSDLLASDLRRIDPLRTKDMKITLVEAQELLGSFDGRLREYAAAKLQKHGVSLIRGVVKEVTAAEVVLTDGDRIPFGLCVWSTGVGPTPFISSLPFAKTGRGRLAITDALQALLPAAPQAMVSGGKEPGGTWANSGAENRNLAAQAASAAGSSPAAAGGSGPAGGRQPAGEPAEAAEASEQLQPCADVFAIGDCSANQQAPLPALAQVAEQQGKHLASCLNRPKEPHPAFKYRSLGALATVGHASAVMDLHSPRRRLSMTGFVSWLAWRSAYLTRLGSLRNRLYVAVNWSTTLLLGRDISAW